MDCRTHYITQVLSKLYNPRFRHMEDGLCYVRINLQKKEKKIHKCERFCKKHRFSIQKIQTDDKQTKIFKIYDNTEVNFCPNQYFGITQGGYPMYNHDGRSDTPAFLNKYEMTTNVSGNKLHSQQFLKRKNRIQQQKTTLEMHSELNEQLNTYSKGKSNFNSQVIEDFQTILKRKKQEIE